MYRLTQAQPGQMPEILAFAERAFAAQEKGPDFARMLPKLYGRGRATESEHTLLYNGDVLEGMYALRVLDAKAAGEPLRVGWIGTVAVLRREARGKGHLERLMQHANRRLETLGCDLGVLGGQRQRYQRFGYDCAGTQWEFCLDARSLRDVPARGLALREIGRASPDLARAEAQYRRGTICCHRAPEDFYDVLCSWDARPWAFYRRAEYAGYCTVQQSGGCAVIWEFCPLRAEDAPAACKAVMQRLQCGALRVSLPPWAGGGAAGAGGRRGPDAACGKPQLPRAAVGAGAARGHGGAQRRRPAAVPGRAAPFRPGRPRSRDFFRAGRRRGADAFSRRAGAAAVRQRGGAACAGAGQRAGARGGRRAAGLAAVSAGVFPGRMAFEPAGAGKKRPHTGETASVCGRFFVVRRSPRLRCGSGFGGSRRASCPRICGTAGSR